MRASAATPNMGYKTQAQLCKQTEITESGEFNELLNCVTWQHMGLGVTWNWLGELEHFDFLRNATKCAANKRLLDKKNFGAEFGITFFTHTRTLFSDYTWDLVCLYYDIACPSRLKNKRKM